MPAFLPPYGSLLGWQTAITSHFLLLQSKKKLGTVIYRKDGDILQALTSALARQSLPDLTEESQLQRGGTFPDEQLATIEEASSAINHCLQEQAQKLQSKYCNAKTPQNVSDWGFKSHWSRTAVIHKENNTISKWKQKPDEGRQPILQPQLGIRKSFIRSLSGVDRCSLSWWSRRGLLEVYEGWTDAASAGHLEEVY